MSRIAEAQRYNYVLMESSWKTAKRPNSNAPQIVSQRILAYMEAYGITAKTLGQYVHDYATHYGISFSAGMVSTYLSRACSPKVDRLTVMALAMGVPTEWLAGYGNNKVPTSSCRQAFAILHAAGKDEKVKALLKSEEKPVAKSRRSARLGGKK